MPNKLLKEMYGDMTIEYYKLQAEVKNLMFDKKTLETNIELSRKHLEYVESFLEKYGFHINDQWTFDEKMAAGMEKNDE